VKSSLSRTKSDKKDHLFVHKAQTNGLFLYQLNNEIKQNPFI